MYKYCHNLIVTYIGNINYCYSWKYKAKLKKILFQMKQKWRLQLKGNTDVLDID